MKNIIAIAELDNEIVIERLLSEIQTDNIIALTTKWAFPKNEFSTSQIVDYNPFVVPRGISPCLWIHGVINIFCHATGILESGRDKLRYFLYKVYNHYGISEKDTNNTSFDTHEKSKSVTFEALKSLIIKYAKDERSLYELTNNKAFKNAGNSELWCLIRRMPGGGFPCVQTMHQSGKDRCLDELQLEKGKKVIYGLQNSIFDKFIFGTIIYGLFLYSKHGLITDDICLIVDDADEILISNNPIVDNNAPRSLWNEFDAMFDEFDDSKISIIAETNNPKYLPAGMLKYLDKVFYEEGNTNINEFKQFLKEETTLIQV